MHLLNAGYGFGAKAAPAQTFKIHAARACRLALGHHKGRHIGKEQAAHGRHGVRGCAGKLVRGGRAAQKRPVAQLRMAGELAIVGKYGVIANHAVVREVDIGHDPVVVADAGDGTATGRADIEGAKLADGVVVAHDELAGFPRVLFILRNRADRVELKNAVVLAYAGVALNHAMRAHAAACAYAHMRADDAIGADADTAVELSLGVDEGGGVNQAHGGTLKKIAFQAGFSG